MTQTEVDRLAESARRAGTARARHGVHARGALPAAALPGADRGRRARRGARPARRQTFDPTPLAEVLADPAIEIVLHAGRQDVAILRREWKTTFTNVFDTQVAAGFAGFSAQAGYNGLLHDVLRIRLPEDRELHALGRAPADRGADLLRARRRRAPDAAGRRHPGAPDRPRPARVGARGVRRDRRGHRRARPGRGLAPAPARERPGPARARRRAGASRPGASAPRPREDRPVGAILRDPTVVELAKRQPTGRRDLSQIRGITPDVVRRRGDDVIAAIERRPRGGADQARGGRPLADRGRRRPDDRARRVAGALARAGGRAGLRADRGPRRPLADRRRRPPRARPSRTCARCSGWRRELVGAELLELLAGHRTLGVGQGGRVDRSRPRPEPASITVPSSSAGSPNAAGSPPAMISR